MITFDLKYIFIFLAGIIFGLFFFGLLYLYAVVISIKRGEHKIKKNPPYIDEVEIELLIKDAQKEFKNRSARKEVGLFPHLKDVSYDLALDIASKYKPKSKYPLLELTMEESLLLTHYIANRIEEFLDKRFISWLFRKRTLAQIKGILDTKTKIEESKIVKAGKKANAVKVGKTVLDVLNIFNGARWLKKVTFDRAIEGILVKIGLVVVAIVGEETYKIYSKKVFQEPKDLETDIDEIYESIKGDLNESI